ncbi:hypothetical protein ACQ27_gp448 [Klebsiella phage K64-1]|nr:hypothetical protein ACQ27_gp448 [Klebsiella phage K64-1]
MLLYIHWQISRSPQGAEVYL